MTRVCPHCKHPVPDLDTERQLWGIIRQVVRILTGVGSEGIMKSALYERIRCADPNVLSNARSRSKAKLASIGLEITTTREGHDGTRWKLKAIPKRKKK